MFGARSGATHGDGGISLPGDRTVTRHVRMDPGAGKARRALVAVSTGSGEQRKSGGEE